LIRDWALSLPVEHKFGLVALLGNAEGSHNARLVVVSNICNMLYFSAENNSPALDCETERFRLERKAILGKLVFILWRDHLWSLKAGTHPFQTERRRQALFWDDCELVTAILGQF